jgi:formylglycine-generating enzyme required for sulfatase activity
MLTRLVQGVKDEIACCRGAIDFQRAPLARMPVVFVSHSSKDDAAVTALETWLHANGFTDTFVDHHGIAGGDKWREELRASAGACRVIICLVTENWLGSLECFGEFVAAGYMGKRIIPLFLLSAEPALQTEGGARLARVMGEFQGIKLNTCMRPNGVLDLTADSEIAGKLRDGLRAAGANNQVGLDPQAFAVDRKLRPTPFPGLASFEDEDADAAIFYGRSREIAEAIEELRHMRAAGKQQPFVILGASGAGKSSLLKAGIIPRLRREAPAWLPLRAFRPGTDPLLSFAQAMSRTFADFGKQEAQGALRDRLSDVWENAERKDGELTDAGNATLRPALEDEGRRLREAAGCTAATILISVDQSEEIARAEGKNGECLSDYLRVILLPHAERHPNDTSDWLLAFTTRTDSFAEVQSHRLFRGLEARGYDLRTMSVFRFDMVVEEPARRYGVQVDAALVDALMEDAPKADALPLLAFTLQRLWDQYADAGTLTKEHYDRFGGLTGLVEDAAERALRGIAPEDQSILPSAPPSQHLLDTAASTFVPALAQLNDQGATIRRIAKWNSFNAEQQQLIQQFERWRLVVRRGEGDAATVEIAHEALFRAWARLRQWLDWERARLETLRLLEAASATWDRHDRTAAFLDHRGTRLADASELEKHSHYSRRLSDVDHQYLVACRKAEQVATRRTRWVRAAIYTLLVGIIAGLMGWINQVYIKEQGYWYAVVRPWRVATIDPYVLRAGAEQALKPKDTFKECASEQGTDYCPEMVVVPAGSFLMGSPPTEKGRYATEGPQHTVTIAEPFAVAKFELTFDEWDTCATYGNCPQGVSDSGWGRRQQPVINVTWDDAQRYAAWLSKMTGKPYRLLTETEYEYATRAGTQTAYPWGDGIGKNNANCNGCGSKWDGRRTAPVGSFQPNALGLYDMVGNVYEWVEDCVHSNYDGAPTDGSAWIEGGNCNGRVVRGGAWNYSPDFLRSAFRDGYYADYRSGLLGFRVGRTLNR